MSRNRLHVNELEAFAEFCASKGWTRQEPKANEALRMRHPEWRDPLIVHRRSSASSGGELVHLTTWNNSETLLGRFLLSKRDQRKLERHDQLLFAQGHMDVVGQPPRPITEA